MNVLIDNVLQIRQRLFPKTLKDIDKLIHDRLKVLERKLNSKLKGQITTVSKTAHAAERKADNLKEAIVRV